MTFDMVGKKMEVSDELKRYAEKKVGKLDKYFKKDASAHLKFSIERGNHNVEITVQNESINFRAHESTQDMYSSIDNAIDSIVRQIHKNKTRLEKRLRQGAFEREPAVEGITPEVYEEVEFDLIRTKRFSIKPMSPEEAILQMNLLGHHFFVFKNLSDNEAFAVVYKRNDGGYGMIEED